MEERWFQIGDSLPVTEGDMTLDRGEILAPRLEGPRRAGIFDPPQTGSLHFPEPKPARNDGGASLSERGAIAEGKAVQKESERLFYRAAEIRQRAKRINESIRPDVVICLHFNAEPWGDATNPQLVDQNHLHFLIAGALNIEELEYEDQRYDMLVKLLNRSFLEELALTDVISRKMASATGCHHIFIAAAPKRPGSTTTLTFGRVICSPIGSSLARLFTLSLTS